MSSSVDAASILCRLSQAGLILNLLPKTIMRCRHYESPRTHPLLPSPLVCCGCGCHVKCATAGPSGGGRRRQELPPQGLCYRHCRRPSSLSPPHSPLPSRMCPMSAAAASAARTRASSLSNPPGPLSGGGAMGGGMAVQMAERLRWTAVALTLKSRHCLLLPFLVLNKTLV